MVKLGIKTGHHLMWYKAGAPDKIELIKTKDSEEIRAFTLGLMAQSLIFLLITLILSLLVGMIHYETTTEGFKTIYVILLFLMGYMHYLENKTPPIGILIILMNQIFTLSIIQELSKALKVYTLSSLLIISLMGIFTYVYGVEHGIYKIETPTAEE